ncbi:Uncharacterized protein APZ42_018140 [Daphnia magna]|uniref:Uncharacterized protein n=1 Tax=Daphnia magna TaxID=35525 RepID=A0A164ZBC9_9CRUS|nr:Uncharacterized protein APZ42_018140 [Daphnia magna]
MKDREPAYRETENETTARLIAQRRQTEDIQALFSAFYAGTASSNSSFTESSGIYSERAVSPPSQSRIFRPPVEPISQPQAADATPRRLRLNYFRSTADWTKASGFYLSIVPKKPCFYRSYSPQPVEQLPDPPTPPGVPESEPDDFIHNIADCEIRSEVGETEETLVPAELEQPVRSWRIRNTRTQNVRTVTSSQLFGNTDQQPRRK